MADFESWRSYDTFAGEIRGKYRYFRTPKLQSFIDTVLATSSQRRRILPRGSLYWRAQQGHGWYTERHSDIELEVPCPFEPERMKPLLGSAREGRVNPKGIPCLYLSTDKDTAMSEVRPWLGLSVSVAQFKTNRELAVVDCSVLHGRSRIWYFNEPPPLERETAVWGAIDHAFSEPVNVDDTTSNYAPTQVLAEEFRANGFDGIVYKSLLGEGFTIALFDADSADLVNCFLFEPRSITFKFEETANPYFRQRASSGETTE